MSSEQLHDVEDVDVFCARVLEVAISRNGSFLRPDQREEVERFLVETTLVLAVRFRPGLVTFERYASHILLLRVNDWYRREFGDARAKNRRHPTQSLDEFLDAGGSVPKFVQPSFDDDALTRVALAR